MHGSVVLVVVVVVVDVVVVVVVGLTFMLTEILIEILMSVAAELIPPELIPILIVVETPMLTLDPRSFCSFGDFLPGNPKFALIFTWRPKKNLPDMRLSEFSDDVYLVSSQPTESTEPPFSDAVFSKPSSINSRISLHLAIDSGDSGES